MSGVKFTQKSFLFAPAATDEYRTEWERIFGPKSEEPVKLYLDPKQIEGCEKIDEKIAELSPKTCPECGCSLSHRRGLLAVVPCRTCGRCLCDACLHPEKKGSRVHSGVVAPEKTICDHCRKPVPEVLTHGGLLLCRTCLGNQ